MPEEKILTLHPRGKQGVNIQRDKYDLIKDALVEILSEIGEIAFRDLIKAAGRRLSGSFEGSISWYVTTVKLDLEARGILRRVPGKKPQRLVLDKNRL